MEFKQQTFASVHEGEEGVETVTNSCLDSNAYDLPCKEKLLHIHDILACEVSASRGGIELAGREVALEPLQHHSLPYGDRHCDLHGSGRSKAEGGNPGL